MCKISVLMPVYKTNEQYLREAIESILNQTYGDFEFLILDDCPSDTREHIVKEFKDSRIVYLKNEKNLGISASRNKLVSLAKGEFLAIFDHDDVSLPYRFERQVKVLEENPKIGVVSGQLEYFVGESTVTKHPELNFDIKKELMHKDIVAHTAMMVRKSVLIDNGVFYEENFSPCEDYMLVLRLVAFTMFYNIQEVLVKYRNSENNTTHIQHEKMKDADALCRCFAKREYPFLYEWNNEHKISWIKLFDILPFIKIKQINHSKKYYLFSILKLFTIK